MPRPLKIAAIVVGSVLGLLVLAAIILVLTVDPNRYRDDIVRAVKTNTGRDFQIEGKLQLSIFPWLGLKTGALQLGNAPGFGREPMARVESAGVQVELLPLLRRRYVIDTIHLTGLTLNLARDKQGRTNWDDLAGKEPAPEKPKEPSTGGALAALSVKGLDVRNANVTWNDAHSGARYAVRGLDLTSGNLLASTPAPIKLAFDLETGKPPVRNRVELKGRLGLDPNAQALNAPELRLAVGPFKLNGAVTGTKIIDAPKFAGRLEIPSFNARALLKELGVGYAPADGKALGAVALSTKFNATAASAALSDFKLTLDDSHLSGNLALQKFSPPSPKFDLAVDTLDLDRYLPAAEKSTDGKPAKDKAGEAVVIPLALLREADAQGRLRVQKLKAFGIRSEGMVLQVAAKNGRITLGPNQAKLYGGTYNGRTSIDANAKPPRFQFDEKLTSIQLGPFLKDADVFDRYTGTGNVDLKLTAQGLDAPSITRTLNGTVAVQLRDGKIQGVNLQKLIGDARSTYDKLRGRTVEAKPQPSDETAFQSLTANIRVTNGIARNDDLKLVGPVTRAEGQGSADLVQQTIDYRLRVTVAEAAGRQGTTLPVTISGPFAGPRYSVDFAELLKQRAGESLEKKLGDRLRQKLKR